MGDIRPASVSEPKTTVSNITQTDNSISFHVDKVGNSTGVFSEV